MVETVKKILRVFNNNNIFNEGVKLIGSWCFQLYQKHLGAKSFSLRTQDIDFLIPHPYRGKEHKDFINQLEELGFIYDFNNEWIFLVTVSRRKKIEKSLKDLQ